MYRFLLVTMLALGVGCATVRVGYDAELTSATGSKQHAHYEESIPIPRRAGLCLLTGAFFGGSCWEYTTLPTAAMQAQVAARARTRIQAATGDYRLLSESTSFLSWQEAAPCLQLADEPVACPAEKEIARVSYVAGGLVGTYFSLGLGHAIQGRYGERGYIFTIGSVLAFTATAAGVVLAYSSQDQNTQASRLALPLFVGGLLSYLGLRIWETCDLWIAPGYQIAAPKQQAGLPAAWCLGVGQAF